MTASDRKWNRMRELYGSGELQRIDQNAYLLCEYDGGINGEGHSGWFSNHRRELEQLRSMYRTVLPNAFYINLCMALEAFGTDREDEVCEIADNWFYSHEQRIIELLNEHAERL